MSKSNKSSIKPNKPVKSTKSTNSIKSKVISEDNDESIDGSNLLGGVLENRIQYPSSIKLDDMYRLLDLYFKQKNIMYSHLHNSFDKFLDDDVHNLLSKNQNIFFEKMD